MQGCALEGSLEVRRGVINFKIYHSSHGSHRCQAGCESLSAELVFIGKSDLVRGGYGKAST
jgi:hypothetical protein